MNWGPTDYEAVIVPSGPRFLLSKQVRTNQKTAAKSTTRSQWPWLLLLAFAGCDSRTAYAQCAERCGPLGVYSIDSWCTCNVADGPMARVVSSELKRCDHVLQGAIAGCEQFVRERCSCDAGASQ